MILALLQVDVGSRSERIVRNLRANCCRQSTAATQNSAPKHGRGAGDSPLATAGAVLVIAAIAIGAWLYQHAQSSAQIERSIAVLPFENLSDDEENAYLAEAIQDEILTRLSKIGDLRVISATSTQHYKSKPENLREIAKQLGVAHISGGKRSEKRRHSAGELATDRSRQ